MRKRIGKLKWFIRTGGTQNGNQGQKKREEAQTAEEEIEDGESVREERSPSYKKSPSPRREGKGKKEVG